jgi:hypothetical protein
MLCSKLVVRVEDLFFSISPVPSSLVLISSYFPIYLALPLLLFYLLLFISFASSPPSLRRPKLLTLAKYMVLGSIPFVSIGYSIELT